MEEIFITHDNKTVTGEPLRKARATVANWYRENARAVKKENLYAAHVTEKKKEQLMTDQLALADRIESGEQPVVFWLWQRLNTELTGECISFLPSSK
jgi:hypothetical protein